MIGIPTSTPSVALSLLVVAAGLLAASGIPSLVLPWRSPRGPRLATGMTVLGALVGLAGAVLALAAPAGAGFEIGTAFAGTRARLGVDPLSAFFALPVFLVGGLGAIYGLGYGTPRGQLRQGSRMRFCYGLLLASLVLITLARDAASFLVAWEGMALANFFLVTTDEEDPEVRAAGWLYLLYSHVTVLGLFALFTLEHQASGSLELTTISAAAPAGLRTAIFAVALIVFGLKAGAMPLHSWLPPAHACAPSHVSALMSGVVIKMGIYGLVRTCGLLEAPPLGWGIALLAVGAVSAFFGVVFALAQHDLKRLLAYHSIENIGIILLGLGLAMVGRALAQPVWVLLGLAGCLLHVWNHALFKSLLFLGAGAVIHATGRRDLDGLGGLSRRMPRTAALFLVGSIAICGLPPLNGFVSELLVYLGLMRTAASPEAAWVAVAVPALAATGALAVACFVKVFGVVFLGVARSPAAREAHESPAWMVAPMVVLAACCAAIGLVPGLVAPALERASSAWAPAVPAQPALALAQVAPLGWMSLASGALTAAVAVLAALLVPVCRRARRRQPELPTWDCGYAASSPRLQYTASSFAEIITSRFGWALRPRVHRPRIEGPFPAPARFESHVEDAVLEGVFRPAGGELLRLTAAIRALPRGQLQRYILWVLAILVPLLALAIFGSEASR